MNKKVILFLNGEPPLVFPELSVYDKIYCTDGSYTYLQQHGIQPDVLSGDFDSINLKSVEHSLRIVNTPNQNYTDFEKAMQIIVDDGYKTVDVYGASGMQQDHFMGNLNAAYKFKPKLKITFFDNYSTYYFLEHQTSLKDVLGKTISLLPFPYAQGITTKGLQYPLQDDALDLTGMIGTRNKAIAPQVEITFKEGELILFIIN
ncbi:MAG TPA: thiamine diphosphokinase [Faecalibacter sp.]